jgi:hypothetical protein
MGFNSAFKGLKPFPINSPSHISVARTETDIKGLDIQFVELEFFCAVQAWPPKECLING